MLLKRSIRLFPVLFAIAAATAAEAAFTYSCLWTFSGGTPQTSTSCFPPPVSFSSPGSKRVTFKVCVASGRCSSISKRVQVLDPKPRVLKITPSIPTPYPGDSLTLSAEATGKAPIAFKWTLPGKIISAANPVTLTVPQNTTRLYASVTATNPSGGSFGALSLPVLDPRPRGSLRLTPNPSFLGQTIAVDVAQLTGRPPFTYKWSLTPDGVSSTSPGFSWNSAGAKAGYRRVELVISNSTGSTKLSRSFNLAPPPLALSFAPVCPNLCFFKTGAPVAFTLELFPSASISRYEYDWDGNGAFEASSTIAVPTVTYSQPGSFRPRIRLTSGTRVQTLFSSRILQISKP